MRALVLAALIALPTAALAQPAPPDPRIATIPYDPGRVVRINGVLRAATQVQFGAGETIQHVALGDGGGWEVAAETGLLFLKPLDLRPATNLIVTTTTADGSLRHYVFELSVRGGAMAATTPSTVFVLRFRYPEAERARLEAAISAGAQVLEQRLVQLRLERGVVEGVRNLDYVLQGPGWSLAPSEVTDNGRFTVLRFPGGQPMPAVYAVTADGTERLVPFDVRGEFMVLHETGARFRLRRGRDVLCIINRAFQAQAGGAPSGAAASDVQRTVREAPR